MKWTKKKPIRGGYYWYKELENKDGEIVRVDFHTRPTNNADVWHIGNDCYFELHTYVDCYWSEDLIICPIGGDK